MSKFEFNLQRFDGEGSPSDAPPETTPQDTPPTETPADDVQTQIAEALAKFKAEIEAERKKREAEAKREAERLSKLSDDERKKAEIETKSRELEEKEAAFEREKLKYEAAKVLGQRGLPVEFTEYLIDEDNAKTLDRIKTFEKQYRKAIEDAVNERLKGKAPTASGKTVDAGDGGKSFLDAIRSQQIRR